MKRLHIIKIGGSVLDNGALLKRFLDDFTRLRGFKILVHGGGSLATNLCKKLDIEVNMHNGRRITDEKTLEAATMVYAGLVNKRLVASLQSRNCNALGLSGADLNSLQTRKRIDPDIDFGLVGDMTEESINTGAIASLMHNGITPVFCAITHNGKGQLLNTNADTLATALGVNLSDNYDVSLAFCFDLPGVMSNPDDPESFIRNLNPEYMSRLRNSGAIQNGMIPKIHNGFEALEFGVPNVRITHAGELLTGKGTKLVL